MKKSELKQLIKEELGKVLNGGVSYEQYLSDVGMGVDEIDDLMYSGNSLGSRDMWELESKIDSSINNLTALQDEIEIKSSLSPTKTIFSRYY